MTITRLLKKVVYAGYVEAPKWDVSLRRGQHDALINFETYQRIQDLLEGKKRAPAARKDYNTDFPLRGFVVCNSCGNSMTAAWSKGCRRHYAYYRCETRGCDAKSKSVARAKLHKGFEEIMQRLSPSRQLVELAKIMFRDAWELRRSQAAEERAEWKRQIKTTEKQIDDLLDRIVDAGSESVVRAYEKRIDKLERQKALLSERAVKELPDADTQSGCMELSLGLLSNPWDIYKNGSHAVQQTVLRLAFSEPLSYCQKKWYGTPEISLPFKVLGEISGQKSKMVLPERFELSTSPLPRECSTPELRQRPTRACHTGVGRACKAFLPQEDGWRAGSLWTRPARLA